MDIDTTPITQAKARAEQVEAEARQTINDAHADYGRAVAELADEHGAVAVARALGITRARVYQLMAKANR